MSHKVHFTVAWLKWNNNVDLRVSTQEFEKSYGPSLAIKAVRA